MKSKITAKRLEITGVVQGVGFRPFLFVLAKRHMLAGVVSNTGTGVTVVIEGPEKKIDQFCRDIRQNAPLLASVTGIFSKQVAVNGYASFQIVKSQTSENRSTLISPDVTVCRDCLAELNDPGDRRYRYPFINCTNCGPRYTIIEDIPYDRPKTSMKYFKMCAACRKEYEDPLNRRFHAQPNACPVCGPKVFLTDAQGQVIEEDPQKVIPMAADLLKSGRILAVKGLGGFHLACDAGSEDAVLRLRKKKNRPHKPFALMARSSSVLFDHVEVGDKEKELLYSYHRPIVLLKKKKIKDGIPGIADPVAPFNTSLGIMLPYTPLHELILSQGPEILVMTSGNRSGEPLSIDNADALDAFSHIADYFLLHDRDIYFRADDSIARVQHKTPRFIRRSRGFAPLPIFYDKALPPVLACGAGLKNTVCLTRDNYLFLSQHIGDLDNVKVFDFFKNSVDHLKRILDIKPELIAHDMHPGLMSTQYALETNGIEKVAVQHHHAHAVACMAENGLNEKVIAVTLDGTGFGTDGRIWGGEVLVCALDGFERKVHLDYTGMPGGDAAVREPWRMATAMLYKAFGEECLDLQIPFMDQMDKGKLQFLFQMLDKGLNTPLTSSCGRVFDAVSALLCIRHEISHESQAAMELEAVAEGVSVPEPYAYRFNDQDNDGGPEFTIDLTPCIIQIVSDIEKSVTNSIISSRFHQTIVNAFCDAAERISRSTGIKKVVLSGGVFNNDIVFQGLIRVLEQKDLTVYTHAKVPTGDGGISFGQAVAAAAMKGKI